MKKILLTVGVCMTLSLLAQAADETELREGPCMKILEACKEYVKNQKTKKNVHRDCRIPLLNDEKVEGVTISAEDLKACKSKKAELYQKK